MNMFQKFLFSSLSNEGASKMVKPVLSIWGTWVFVILPLKNEKMRKGIKKR